MNSKMKPWTVSWLSLKTKVELGLRESRVMSVDWQRLHRVRGVSGGSPENHWVPWLIHKAKTEESKTEMQQLQTGLTGEEHRSDRCATTQSGDFEEEDTRWDPKACVEAKQVAAAEHPSAGAMTKISDFALEGHVSLISYYGYFRLSVASYITQEVRGWQQSLGTLVHLLSYFLRISIGLA
jgi:hypothetical protein